MKEHLFVVIATSETNRELSMTVKATTGQEAVNRAVDRWPHLRPHSVTQVAELSATNALAAGAAADVFKVEEETTVVTFQITGVRRSTDA